jgi:hypothetical protein
LQTGYALAAVGLGDAFAAGVQAGFAQTRSFVMEEAFITDGDAPRPLEDQGAGAGETSVFGGAVAGLASRVARLAQAAVEILIDVAAVAPVRHAPPLRVDLPVLQTRYASGLVTFRTSRGALYTLVLVRIRIVMSRTFLYATTFVPEALLTARDALGTVRTLARFARLVAGGAPENAKRFHLKKYRIDRLTCSPPFRTCSWGRRRGICSDRAGGGGRNSCSGRGGPGSPRSSADKACKSSQNSLQQTNVFPG